MGGRQPAKPIDEENKQEAKVHFGAEALPWQIKELNMRTGNNTLKQTGYDQKHKKDWDGGRTVTDTGTGTDTGMETGPETYKWTETQTEI